MNKTLSIIAVILFYSNYVSAGDLPASVSISFSPNTNVYSDIDENEAIIDRYSKYNFDFSEGYSIRANLIWPIYFQFERLTAERRHRDSSYIVNSFSVGTMSGDEQSNYGDFRGYYYIGAGIGLSEFNFQDENVKELQGVGEIFGEAGVIIFNRVTAGVGLKGQILGYPSETTATSIKLFFSLGVLI